MKQPLKSIVPQMVYQKKTFLDGDNVKAYFFHRDDETGKVVIEELPVEEGGIPMKTFYETVEKMRKQDEQIDEMLYSP